MLSTEASDSNIGNLLYYHLDGHSNTLKGMQFVGVVVLPIIDINLSVIHLLVELAVDLVHSVLRIPAISQQGQEVDRNGREPRRADRHGLANDLRCGTHLKQGSSRMSNDDASIISDTIQRNSCR